MVITDQQFSITLGQPFALSDLKNCLLPDISSQSHSMQSLLKVRFEFGALTRRILASGTLDDIELQRSSDKLLSLLDAIPGELHFNLKWLDPQALAPAWPLDTQTACLHQEVHNFIIFLNKYTRDPNISSSSFSKPYQLLGFQQRILKSCREVLAVFEYFTIKQQGELIHWKVCQQAFNAATILISSLSEVTEDYYQVSRTRETFSRLSRLGVHRLADVAADNLERLLSGVESGENFSRMLSDHPTLVSRTTARNHHTTSSHGVRMTTSNQAKLHPKSTFKSGNESRMECKRLVVKERERMKLTMPGQAKNTVSSKWQHHDHTTVAQHVTKASATEWAKHCRSSDSPKQHSVHINDQAVFSIQQELSPEALVPTSTPLSVAESISPLQNMQLSAGTSTTDSYVLEPCFSNSQPSAQPSVELQTFTPSHPSMASLAYATTHSSQPSSIASNSYPSSVYANSIPSSLHTPTASHPVSPNISHTNVRMQTGDGSNAYGCSHTIAQSQAPSSWAFDVPTCGSDSMSCLPVESCILVSNDGRWEWQA